VLFKGVPAVNSMIFQDHFDVDTGSDRDYIHICGVTFGDEVDVELGYGNDVRAAGEAKGGLYLCNSILGTHHVWEDVEFDGGRGTDGFVIENVTGIAAPANTFVTNFEQQFANCSDLGGSEAECMSGQ
jgi:hypothetical protein